MSKTIELRTGKERVFVVFDKLKAVSRTLRAYRAKARKTSKAVLLNLTLRNSTINECDNKKLINKQRVLFCQHASYKTQ